MHELGFFTGCSVARFGAPRAVMLGDLLPAFSVLVELLGQGF